MKKVEEIKLFANTLNGLVKQEIDNFYPNKKENISFGKCRVGIGLAE